MALPGARGCWPGIRAELTAPRASAAVEVGWLGQGAGRDDDGMTVDDPFVARLPAPNELDHLDQEEQRDEATGQELKEQESKHATSMAGVSRGSVTSRGASRLQWSLNPARGRSIHRGGGRGRRAWGHGPGPRSRRPRPASTEPQPHRPAAKPGTWSVPQWMGIAVRAPTSRAASTAVAGSSRSGPRGGPQRPTGNSATSTCPASRAISGYSAVSPAKYTLVDPSMR